MKNSKSTHILANAPLKKNLLEPLNEYNGLGERTKSIIQLHSMKIDTPKKDKNQTRVADDLSGYYNQSEEFNIDIRN